MGTSALCLKLLVTFSNGCSVAGVQVGTALTDQMHTAVNNVAAKLRDRQHAMKLALHGSLLAMTQLICVCLGLPLPSSSSQPGLSLGILAQARYKLQRDRKLHTYLYLNKFESHTTGNARDERAILLTRLAGPVPPRSRLRALSSRLINFFINESIALSLALKAITIDSNTAISPDSVHVATSFFIIGFALLQNLDLPKGDQQDQFSEVLDDVKASLKSCLRTRNERRQLMGGFLGAFDSVLGSIDRIISGKDLLTQCAANLARGFDAEFWTQTMHVDGVLEDEFEQDVMDLESNIDSQRSSRKDEATSMECTHFEVVASTCASALRASTAAKMYLLSRMDVSNGTRNGVPYASSSLIEYLTSLPGLDFLQCRSVLLELLDLGAPIKQSDATLLLQYLAEVLLRQYEFERSEVALGTILNIMTHSIEFWINDEGSDAVEIGEAVYLWFVGTALGKRILSPYVHICLASLLQKIVKMRHDYCSEKSNCSARTHLLHILKIGNPIVKINISNNLSEIFGLYVLQRHEEVFDDVADSLPLLLDWIEGINLRLYILAELAASWSTLLRQAVYWIIECAKNNPRSVEYAQTCLQHTAMALQLSDIKDLFKIFAPQVLHTWFQSESPLASLPYAIFGYPRLSDLLTDIQGEVIGLVFLRGKDGQAKELAAELEMSFDTLLETCFSKVSAYCIARDSALGRDNKEYLPRAEPRLRDALGKERYAILMNAHFAEILAILIEVAWAPDSGTAKSLQKYSTAVQYACYEEMMDTSGPEKTLPASQEPKFDAKYLFHEIEFLCRRLSCDVHDMWKPELYMFVFRAMISSIHPALGPLHACSFLRKIRLLVSLAGSTALELYPLEMALHSLKPYLTSTQCADEAMGISKYLLKNGAQYLERVPAFLAGYAVSTLTSMKEFFDSTQESTTQETQSKDIMSRAQAFHRWFSSYLAAFRSPQLDDESAKCFSAIVKAASHIQAVGNARSGTYESDLLLECLEDERSGRNLLDETCRNTILKFLCTSFEVPLSFREDVLGSDEDASRYAPVVWKSCQREVSGNFVLWAGRVLGRAYAHRGLINREMIREALYDPLPQHLPAHMVVLSSTSRVNILKLVSELLRNDDATEVGKAEATLSTIITKTIDTEDFLEVEQSLSSSLLKSLAWSHYQLPKSPPLTEPGLSLKNVSTCEGYRTARQWVQAVSITLALSASDDPILSEIARIIQLIDRLAEKTFPYILHLVLLQEMNGNRNTRNVMSEVVRKTFQQCKQADEEVSHSARILLQAVLYLRTQPLPNETTKADRDKWLDFDYKDAAAAAIHCSMYKVALLFIEIDYSEISKASRRTSSIKSQEPTNLLLAIYENIDEQDAFYGVQQPSSLHSMMTRLEYEEAGFKSLSFRGAHYDGKIRLFGGEHRKDEESLADALGNLDMNGLSRSLLSGIVSRGGFATDSILHTARRLEQWDISSPTSQPSSASTIYRAFQGVSLAVDTSTLAASLNSAFSDAMNQLKTGVGAKASVQSTLSSLAVLTEADEVFSCRKSVELKEVVRRFEGRESWMLSERSVNFLSTSP